MARRTQRRSRGIAQRRTRSRGRGRSQRRSRGRGRAQALYGGQSATVLR